MAIWNKWFAKTIRRLPFPSAIGGWQTPPERDVKGYLSAYGEIYSLFGVALRIATAVSEVKWRLYKGTERSERSQIASHPILNLLDFANEFQTGQEIMELTQLHMDLAGKAYWYLPRNGLGVPGETWVLPPHLVEVVPSKTGFIKGYTYNLGNEKIDLDKELIIRFPMPDPLNPYGSVGYAQAAAIELDSELYAGKWNRNFFFNSARPDGALEVPDELNEQQRNDLREGWGTKHGGLSRAHKVAILESGMQYKQIQMSQKDMDFSGMRKQTREALLFTFGMPLSVMGISENVNRANAEAGDYTFARWLIKPRLTRIKNKLNEQLLPMFPKAVGVEIDFDEVVPETIEQKKDLAESGMRSSWMLINEARKINGYDLLPPEIGDRLLIPLNMIPTSIKRITPVPKPPAKSYFPTEEHKEAYWKLWVAKTEGFERALIGKLRDMFAKQEKEALSKLKKRPGKDTRLIDLRQAKKDYKEAVEATLRGMLQQSLDDAEGLINPEPAHRSKQDRPNEQALAWMATRIGWAAEEVGEETAHLLSVQLAQGLEAGESIPNIANRVRGVFEYCDRARSRRIARTETIMASNEGALYGYEESGVVEKAEFYPAPDACEEFCAPLDGQEFPIGEAHGIIPLHSNCRCTWLPVV